MLSTLRIISKLTLALLLFFISSVLDANEELTGNYFTKKTILLNGFSMEQITLFPYGDKDRFMLSRFSYNKYRGYEENKIYGTILHSSATGDLILKGNECSVYAVRTPGKKWVLIRHFDCDHLEFQLVRQGSQILLTPGVSMDTVSIFPITNSGGNKNTTSCVIFKIEENKADCWGTGMKFIRKNSRAYIGKQSIMIEETVESTGKFKIENGEEGDLIQIENAPVRDIFD